MDVVVNALTKEASETLLGATSESGGGFGGVLSGSVTTNAANVVQHSVAPSAPAHPVLDANDAYEACAYSKETSRENPSKMILLAIVNFDHTWDWGQNDKLQLALPKAFWKNHSFPAYGTSRYFQFFRGSFHIKIQANAAAGTSGSFIVVYVPNDHYPCWNNRELIMATMFNWPHVIFNVATMTEADLYIPYINTHNFANTDSSECGWIVVAPFTHLEVAGATTNILDIAVFGSLVDFQFQGPRPFTELPTVSQAPKRVRGRRKYKFTRNKIDIAEGPGAMNVANVLSTTAAQSIALVGERAFIDPSIAGTKVRVRSFREIVKIKALTLVPFTYKDVNKSIFDWPAAHTPGKGLFEQGYTIRELGNLGPLSTAYQFWRGSIIFTLTIFASSFHRGRLRIVLFPNGTHSFGQDDANALLFTVCDIGEQSSFDITLPFTHNNWVRECDNSIVVKLKVFVETRLAHNNSSANAIKCVIFVRGGEDFEFLAPCGDTVKFHGWGSDMDEEDPLDDMEPGHPDCLTFESKDVSSGQGPMCAQLAGLSSVENDGTTDDQLNSVAPKFINIHKLTKSIFTKDHMLLDYFFGRAWFVMKHNYEDEGRPTIHLDMEAPSSMHGAAMNYFSFWAGEINFHLVNNSDDPLAATHSYSHEKSTIGPTTDLGVILVPPRQMISFAAPFYSWAPLRPVLAHHNGTSKINLTFGILELAPEAPKGQIIIYASLRTPNFFLPKPFPIQTNAVRLAAHPSKLTSQLEADFLKFKLIDGPYEQFFTPFNGDIPSFQREFINWLGSKEELQNMILQCGDVEQNPGPVLMYDGNKKFCVPVSKGYLTFHGSPEQFLVSGNGTLIIYKEVFGMLPYEEACPDDLSSNWHVEWQCINGKTDALVKKLANWMLLRYIDLVIFGGTWKKLLAPNTDMKFDSQGVDDMMNSLTGLLNSSAMELLGNDVSKSILCCLVRFVAVLVMFFRNPDLINGVALASYLASEFSSVRIVSSQTAAFVDALFNGDLYKLSEQFLSMMDIGSDSDYKQLIKETLGSYPPEMNPFESQSLAAFNALSLSARNCTWWIELFQKLHTFVRDLLKPDTSAKFHEWGRKNKLLISNFMYTLNEHLKECVTTCNLRKREFRDKHKWLLSVLNRLTEGFTTYGVQNDITRALMDMRKSMLSVKLGQEYQNACAREEPLGVLLRGEPGQGKSFMTHLLVRSVCNAMGWKVSESVFSHPTSSEFFDGYAGQPIHLIDDFGQNVEEPEYKVLCQCMSSIPFSVPMASLEEKGLPYTSKLVIATTNKSDWSSRTLCAPGALKRRFPIVYTVRARRTLTKNGLLDVNAHMNAVRDGAAWEYTTNGYDWQPFSVNDLAAEIIKQLEQRRESFQLWNSFISQAPETFEAWCDDMVSLLGPTAPVASVFDYCASTGVVPILKQASESVLKWFDSCIDSIASFVTRNKKWIAFDALTMSVLGIAISMLKELDSQRPYNSTVHKMPTTKLTRGRRVLVSQGPYNEFQHYSKYCVFLPCGSVTLHGVAFGNNSFLFYTHGLSTIERYEGWVLDYNGSTFDLDIESVDELYLNGESMDLCIVTCKPLPITFASIVNHLSDGDFGDGVILWRGRDGLTCMPMYDLHHYGTVTTNQGDTCTSAIRYRARTTRGMCGGLVLSKISGSYKVVGLHVAGNGVYGVAASLNVCKQLESQGLVTDVKPWPGVRVHQPSKSVLKPSPLYGFVEQELHPAVLSPFDGRLKCKVDSVIGKQALKYNSNVFNPGPHYDEVLEAFAIDFNGRFGVNEMMSSEEVFALAGEEALDLSTSPGLKYTSKGLKKRDLVPGGKASDLLLDDVECLINDPKGTPVYFYCHLKDELRPQEKIEQGLTRCIESSDFDYVISAKRVFCKLFRQLYDSDPIETGFAVGINCIADWKNLLDGMYDYIYDFDMKGYDGSIPRQLMIDACRVLSESCSDEELAYNLLYKTVDSQHVVGSQLLTVSGGMASGSPFTTIVNTACNILANMTVLEETGVEYTLVCYGDDILISTSDPISVTDYVDRMRQYFGFTVKLDGDYPKNKLNFTFLKRRTTYWNGIPVGAMEVDLLLQHLGYCRSVGVFQDQLNSASIELALHGPETYNELRSRVNPFLSGTGFALMSYRRAAAVVDSMLS
ncbi:polyprotein [pasivirus A3]|uniref:Genome polyprotein n=1 Tax=pasivirus A3 TaxID=2773286 RepID=A0A0A0R237_9PICO|nr:polyprotein [pasivirus A3]